jgi:hypothetical protein
MSYRSSEIGGRRAAADLPGFERRGLDHRVILVPALLTASLAVLAPPAASAAKRVSARAPAKALTAKAAAGAPQWRGCSGIEEGFTTSLPAALRGQATLAASLSLKPAAAGWAVSAQPVRDAGGRELLLVRLKPAAGTRPGQYRGELVLRCSGKGARLPLAAEVLPFALMRPSKQYSLTRVPVGPQTCAPEEADAARLRPLRDLGIGSLCLTAPPADRAAMESAMRGAGLRGPVLAPAEAVSDRTGEPPAVSPTPDESRTAAAPLIRWYALLPAPPAAADAIAALRAGGRMVACRMEAEGEGSASTGIDLPIYEAGGPNSSRFFARTGPLSASTVGWWRWDATTAAAHDNRLRCGALLWKSGLSGALVEIDPERSTASDWPLQWEGIRQGVLDSRYMTTLFALMRQVKDMDKRHPLPAQAEAAVGAAMNGLTRQPSATTAARFRETLISWIVRLDRVVGG